MTGPDFGIWLFVRVMKWPLIFCFIVITYGIIVTYFFDRYGNVSGFAMMISIPALTAWTIYKYVRRRWFPVREPKRSF
jgi:hypothetical protein